MKALPVFLHVFATFGAGGPQARATQIMAATAGRFRHRILAMDGCTEARRFLGDQVPAEFLPAPPHGTMRAAVQHFCDLLARQRPDLVLTYNWGAIEAVWAARRLRLPLVHHEDGFGPAEVVRRFRRRNWLRRWLLRRVPVIVPSAVLADLARREWWLSRLSWLPNGVDLERFSPAVHSAAAPLVVGSVGGLRAEKDHANLLRAVARMADRSVRLVLVGDGDQRAALEAEANALQVRDRVEFIGSVGDPVPQLRRFDVFALPSRTEQMPLSLLEAMACALPVVATDVGDVRRIVPEQNAAGIVPASDPARMAAALDELVKDPLRREREGLANRRRCEERYELGSCLQRYIAVYEAALARRA